jgi:cobalt-zinc-cadmium efflux system outer membrane protein
MDRRSVRVWVGVLVVLVGGATVPAAAAQSAPLPDTLTFERATALLLEHNPQLRAVRSRAQAEAQAAENAARYPNPTLTLSEERTNLEGDGVDDQWYLNVRQPLDYPGEARARNRSAAAVESAAEARTQEAAADLYRQLRHRYLAVVEAQARRDVLARVTEAVRRAARAGDVRYEEGDLGTFQRARLNVARATYENDLADAERALRTARAELAVLLLPSAQADLDSLRAGGTPAVAGSLAFRPVTVDPDDALQRARQERGRLVAARARLEAEMQTLDATRYQRYPDLSLSAGPKRQSLPGADTYGYTAGLSVGLPLWNGGGAAVRAQQGRQEAAAADLDAARRAVDLDVYDALQRVNSYRTRIERLSDEVLGGTDALRDDALFVYQQGEISLFELLDALDAARQSALLRTRLTADYLRSLYDLAFALGVGPTDDPLLVRGALTPRNPSLE